MGKVCKIVCHFAILKLKTTGIANIVQQITLVNSLTAKRQHWTQIDVLLHLV